MVLSVDCIGGKKLSTCAIILAAGQGQRMKSSLPKPLHKIAGYTMVEHVVRNVKKANFHQVYLVVGYQGDLVRQAVPDIEYVEQKQQLGTGHAVDQCRKKMEDFDGTVLVTYVDTPLFRPETFKQVLAYHLKQKAAATVITADVDDPTGYGRIVRTDDGYLSQIVEHKDATEVQKQITEINTGTYCFDSKLLFKYIGKITPDNLQAEYYLPDVIPLMIEDGHLVAGFCLSDSDESMGINQRVQLAQAEKIMQRRICHEHMLAGVTIINPEQTYIEAGCEIGNDTIIYPNTYIQCGTKIGKNCTIGPNVRLVTAQLGEGVTIEQAVVTNSSIGSNTTVGPFAYIRPGSAIGMNCKIGDFVEVKNSRVGDKSKIPHHSYIGDAVIGTQVNIGCGVITCNYDGQKKYQTIVDDNSFVGSNVNLVAPVRVNKGAYIAAGSTITKDVPEKSLGIGRARQVNKEGWKAEGDQ